jgi:hypothetical protein
MGTVNERGNKLFLDFRYRGVRCREYTKLEDKPANRKRLKILMERIEAEILLGTFDYAEYFQPISFSENQRSEKSEKVGVSDCSCWTRCSCSLNLVPFFDFGKYSA